MDTLEARQNGRVAGGLGDGRLVVSSGGQSGRGAKGVWGGKGGLVQFMWHVDCVGAMAPTKWLGIFSIRSGASFEQRVAGEARSCSLQSYSILPSAAQLCRFRPVPPTIDHGRQIFYWA